MNENMPKVSVILPVYNASDFIEVAIESILNQSYENFELIIINDGSTDDTSKKIEKLKDNRIVYKERENRGLISTLNEALDMCTSNFIMRMDSDDICDEKRIEVQLSYLVKNTDVAVVGSRSKIIDTNGNIIGKTNVPLTDYIIKCSAFCNSPFTHPSVMFNKKLIEHELHYNKDALHVEDFELWLRLVNIPNIKLVNIKKELLYYRINTGGISSNNKELQQQGMNYWSNKILGINSNFTNSKEKQKISDILYQSLIGWWAMPNDKYKLGRLIFVVKLIKKEVFSK